MKSEYYRGYILKIEESGAVHVVSLQGTTVAADSLDDAKAKVDEIYRLMFGQTV